MKLKWKIAIRRLCLQALEDSTLVNQRQNWPVKTNQLESVNQKFEKVSNHI